jgi:hypothetical protein
LFVILDLAHPKKLLIVSFFTSEVKRLKVEVAVLSVPFFKHEEMISVHVLLDHSRSIFTTLVEMRVFVHHVNTRLLEEFQYFCSVSTAIVWRIETRFNSKLDELKDLRVEILAVNLALAITWTHIIVQLIQVLVFHLAPD